ncbi:MAG: DUF2167 domain-containing protein [Flavobacteriales bacterium]|nr:MAG: DUF2167 domain-containing protein [Flavobacteriales bacterium]
MSILPSIVLAIPFAIADTPDPTDTLSSVPTGDLSDSSALMFMAYVDSVEGSFKWQTGAVPLADGAATINVPAGFKFLDAAQSAVVLVEHWGNPSAEGTLGMLFPENEGVLDEGGYAFIITYDEMGFVEDGDAADINYDDMLVQLKEEDKTDNQARAQMGYDPVYTIGWASKPYYDNSKKVLHWAKELQFGDSTTSNTLNYNVRILGRKGVLQLNAVSDMSELDNVKANIPAVLSMATFNDGYRYDQFDDSTDEIAALSVGGLVAGKVLAKAGLFAGLGKFLKFIILGIIAAGAGIWRLISGRKKNAVPEGAQIIKP